MNLWRLNDTSDGLGPWQTKNNILFVTMSDNGAVQSGSNNALRIKRISPSKMLLENFNHHSVKAMFYECDRQNLAPSPPSSLTYSLPSDNSSSSINPYMDG